jgi:hypothetical protein
MLRRKLEISGVDLYDTEEEGAPTPEAVRVMAREMEMLNAPAQHKSASTKSAPKVSPTPAVMSRHASVGANPSTGSFDAQPYVPPKVTHAVSYTSGLRPPADTSLMFSASIAQALERDPSGISIPGPAAGSPSLSQGKFSPESAASANAIKSHSADEDGYDDDFEQDAASKPGTAKKPDAESAPEAPPPLLQVKQFSRKFEQIELNVPDIARFTKGHTDPKKQVSRHHSINDDRLVAGRDAEETVGAVQEAFAFNYGNFEADHPQIIATAKELLNVPDKEYSGSSKKAQTPPSPKREPAAQEDEYGDNDFDRYEDDFAATSQTDEPLAQSRSEQEVSPHAQPATYGSPSTKQSTKEAMQSVPEGTGETDAAGEAEAYEDDNYEEEFEADEDRPKTGKANAVAVQLPASTKASPTKAQSVKATTAPAAAEEEDEYPDFDALEESKPSVGVSGLSTKVPAMSPSVKVAPKSVKTAAAASAALEEDEDYPDFGTEQEAGPAPVPSKTIAPLEPAPLAAASAPPGATPTKPRTVSSRPATAEEGDEYGDEDFDDYEVSKD